MNNKDEDLLFMRLLLMHGGDPEPYLSHATPAYVQWRNAVQDTLVELNYAETTKGFPTRDEFEVWLGKRGLAYVSPNE